MLWLVFWTKLLNQQHLNYQTLSENRAASIETTTKNFAAEGNSTIPCFKIIKNLWRLVGYKHKKVEEIFDVLLTQRSCSLILVVLAAALH